VFPALSVKENFRMAVRKSAKNEAREGVNLATTLFPVLSERMNQVAGTLSGGEQQMLALGSALATRPALLIADELSLGLAPKVVDSVFESLWEARRLGIGVVLIEQFVGRALNFCDEALVLRRGTIVWSGDADGAHESVAAKYIS
jgi:branched-chain amino acid transport system ATP-binding protein